MKTLKPRSTTSRALPPLTKQVAICLTALALLSCGTDDCTEAGPFYLVGDWTDEEARALTEVSKAIVDAGFQETGYAVNFVHDPNASFKGTTWSR